MFKVGIRISRLCVIAQLVALMSGCQSAQLDEPALDPEVGVSRNAIVQDALVLANRDTYVRELAPTKNYGAQTAVRVQGLDRARSIVQFDQAALVAAAAGRTVTEASLELTVQEISWIWGQISAHRVKSASTELGATWSCANDTITSNSTNNCTTANSWQMNALLPASLAYVATASDTQGVSSGATVVKFNVTADVQAFLAGTQTNNGWLLKMVIDAVPGVVAFRSRESATPPRLVLDLAGSSCVPVASTDVTCNGIDDNCNGTVDEGYVAVATSCGVGACAATGSQTCVSGALINSCAPSAPAAGDATCDGIDNNCNGSVDEGYVATATSCGVGACGATGVQACVSGALVNTCAPSAPAASDASCDGIDNNCNGSTDEGYVVTPTTCGLGACANNGTQTCVSGSLVNTCTPRAASPTDATCNNFDDDCNGTRDEDFVATPTTCGVGSCGSFGSTLCSSGHIVDTCLPGVPAANDATCNGRDNDCNGQVDEDFASTPTTCGINACTGTGATSCAAGTVTNSCLPLSNCEADCGNATDDDNDGFTDCTDFDCDGVGACDSTVGDDCDADTDCTAISGGEALCLSESSTGIPGGFCSQTCTAVPGACPESSQCLGGLCLLPCGAGSTCGAGEACFEVEDPGACIPVCDTDDDCVDGSVCNLTTGFCDEPNCAADDTTCDGLDDDCDGNVDEDFAGAFGGDVSCGASTCFEVGSLVCSAGLVTDTCAAPQATCTQEAACGDAADNDGDGFADCADPDCEQTPACLADASSVAGTCAINADCRSVTGPAVCLAAPGGYCSNFCDTFDPSTCPDNATCSGGICLARCNPADGPAACARPDHVCILEAGDYVCLPPA